MADQQRPLELLLPIMTETVLHFQIALDKTADGIDGIPIDVQHLGLRENGFPKVDGKAIFRILPTPGDIEVADILVLEKFIQPQK